MSKENDDDRSIQLTFITIFWSVANVILCIAPFILVAEYHVTTDALYAVFAGVASFVALAIWSKH